MYQTHQWKEHAILGTAFSRPYTHQDMNRAAQNNMLSVTNLHSQISAGAFIREDIIHNFYS